MEELQVRKVALENLGRLSEMFEVCLGRPVDESYFKWKYVENPSGKTVAFEAVDGENMAAFYGVMPEKYVCDGKPFLAYQSMDTMTHPNYQKRGLFTKLARKTYQFLEEQEPRLLIVGVPGSNSFHGFVNKLQWKHVINLSYLFVNRLVFGLTNLFSGSKDVRVEAFANWDEETSVFYQQFYASRKSIRPYYDNAILQWKTVKHPFKQFQLYKLSKNGVLKGIAIVSFEENKAKIELADFITDNVAENAQCLKGLIQHLFAENTGLKWVYTWEPTLETLKATYKKIGFMKNNFNKGPFSYRVPFIVYLNQFDYNDPSDLISRFDLQPFVQD